jgi:DNA-directed RNA polymerase specialized sigma subunit
MLKAVITGDIIQSTKLTPEQRQSLLENIERNLKILDEVYKMKSEIYRGDSFQCLLNTENALIVALIIKTYIRGLNPSVLYDLQSRKEPLKKNSIFYTNYIFDARIAIGIGETEETNKKLASSNGQAFLISGHLLDEIKNTKQTLIIGSSDEYNDELETESILLDAIISKTSALQCHVINLKLRNLTEIQIAEKLNIGQSAVNQRSTAGNWNAIESMRFRFEEIYGHD